MGFVTGLSPLIPYGPCGGTTIPTVSLNGLSLPSLNGEFSESLGMWAEKLGIMAAWPASNSWCHSNHPNVTLVETDLSFWYMSRTACKDRINSGSLSLKTQVCLPVGSGT